MKFAPQLAVRDWPAVLDGYSTATAIALRPGLTSSAGFTTTSLALSQAIAQQVAGARAAVERPAREWAASLRDVDVNLTRPTVSGGAVLVLEGGDTPRGVVVPLAELSNDEADAICWSAWSVYQLLNALNFATVPAAFARVEATGARWERYASAGPLQLPHELLLNRLARPITSLASMTKYDPPRIQFIAAHPFAGFELRRRGANLQQSQSAAAHLLGVTLWLGDWRTHVSATWIAAVSDDVLGQGAILRLDDVISAGFIDRRVSGSPVQRSLIIQVDALRLIADDAQAKRLLSLFGISGVVLHPDEKN
jgi:hypothetical protein